MLTSSKKSGIKRVGTIHDFFLPSGTHAGRHIRSLFLLYLFGMSTDSVLLTLFVTANVLDANLEFNYSPLQHDKLLIY